MPKASTDVVTSSSASIDTTPVDGKVKKVRDEKVKRKKRRYKPGTVANREIKKFQQGIEATKFLIPEAPVYRWVKEIMAECGVGRIEEDAITVIRVALEDESIKLMRSAQRLAEHAGRKTIMKEDLDAVKDVRTIHPEPIETRTNRSNMISFPNLPFQYNSKEPEESSRVTEVGLDGEDLDK